MILIPCKEHDECVEVEIGLALRLGLVVCPDHRQHRHALQERLNKCSASIG